MRELFVLVFGAASLCAQMFSFGVKGGVPLTDLLAQSLQAPIFASSVTNRYLVGPTVELRLPFGVSAELDAIYRHFGFTQSQSVRMATPPNVLVSVFTTSRTAGSDWEFPLLAKYRWHTPVVRPYLNTGIAWDFVGGSSTSTATVFHLMPLGPPTTSAFTGGVGAQRRLVSGFVAGGGSEFHAGLLRIAPEIRFTRWFSQHFTTPAVEDGMPSNQNQVEFLVGITF
jgi:hypothetical protein